MPGWSPLSSSRSRAKSRIVSSIETRRLLVQDEPKQTLVGERLQHLELVDGGDSRISSHASSVAPPTKIDKTSKQAAARSRRVGRNSGDGVAHRLLPGRQIALATAEDVQAVIEAGQQRLRREVARTRCGKLDGERQAVQALTDFDNAVGILRRDFEVGLDQPRSFNEEPHRLRGPNLSIFALSGSPESEVESALWRRSCGIASGGKGISCSPRTLSRWRLVHYASRGQCSRRSATRIRRAHHLLQVVQNEEQVLLLKLLQDKVSRRHGAWIAKLQRVRNCRLGQGSDR